MYAITVGGASVRKMELWSEVSVYRWSWRVTNTNSWDFWQLDDKICEVHIQCTQKSQDERNLLKNTSVLSEESSQFHDFFQGKCMA